jgi:hypothetical protein
LRCSAVMPLMQVDKGNNGSIHTAHACVPLMSGSTAYLDYRHLFCLLLSKFKACTKCVISNRRAQRNLTADKASWAVRHDGLIIIGQCLS